ncbi:MAM domain-containing glycosylphosphatidylinositol anchor protein 2 isoform X2 [Dendroctonus ponderosae]|nr:MAM domain-containing glycosylphosphatidylinositol anchor protein 2 isoform X2 [Dendroctonus ponderosae]XP_048521046.1 MAM domain-containing glycosylphosphatidylinositol anchor protein 2 isoform X2 [Dendroctonus ponderosae]
MFVSREKTFRVVTGDTVVLPCEINNLGSFVVVWKRGLTLLSAGEQKISRDPRISLVGFNLQIKDIKHADQGNYACQIGDGLQGELIHSIEILMPPSLQITPPSGQVVTRKGGPVSFECRANGNPNPTVQWSKRDGLLPSGLQVETNYMLNINEVRRQDGGIYQCTASNGIGQPVTGEIKLHVLYPPEVKVLRSWVNSGEGLEAKLDCVVHSDPPAEVTWYQDSFQLQPTDRRLMLHNGQTHSLIIKNVQMSDFGNYSCLVTNSIGRDKRYIELSGKPGPAKIISSQYSNPHEYDLKWTVQSVFPIIEVRVLFKKIMINSSYHHPGQWHDLLIKPSQSYNSATSERTQSYRLHNLQADSTYECVIQTKNQHGYGELSDTFQWYTAPKGRIILQSNGGVFNSFSEVILLSILSILLMISS